MIEGHGDDAYKYKAIKINFSSNVYNHVDHSAGTLFIGKGFGETVSSFV